MNMAEYFLDSRISEGAGQRIAIYFEDDAMTYANVQRMANQVSEALSMQGLWQEEREGGRESLSKVLRRVRM